MCQSLHIQLSIIFRTLGEATCFPVLPLLCKTIFETQNFFQLQTVSHPKRINHIAFRNVCLVTRLIHICQNRCSSSKGILESSVRNILVKNWLSRCVSRICPVPLHCPVTLTATLGNPVIHGETALSERPPRQLWSVALSSFAGKGIWILCQGAHSL